MAFLISFPDFSLDIPVEDDTKAAANAALSHLNEDEVSVLRALVLRRETTNRRTYCELVSRGLRKPSRFEGFALSLSC